MYGSRFLDQFGTEPNDLWVRAVDDLTDAQIKTALTRLVREGGEHPPTLPKFAELARKPESSVRNTFTPTKQVDVWQRMANQVFHQRLRACMANEKRMIPAESGHVMLEGLRKLKAAYAREHGSNPDTISPDTAEAFTAAVWELLDGLADDA